MLHGVHGPNLAFSQEDKCRLRLGGFEAMELMWYHTEADVVALRALGCRYFLMRLPDSVDAGGRWKGDREWAAQCIALIKRFYPLGVRDYQLDNEPNLTWGQTNAGTWRWLTEKVVRLIRQSSDVPTDVRLGLAPLAWTPRTWAGVESVWIPEQRLIKDLFQWAAVHSYWQAPQHYNSPSFGGNITHWHDRFLPGMPLVVTEWASSIHETGISPEQAEAQRLIDYPKWLAWVATKPYVESVFLYILGGTTHDWGGFHASDKLLRAIAR